jgi:N-methylhydantoinase B
MLDGMIGSTGPTPRKDGDFADGHVWIPEGQGPNVEAYERDWPILYLYRGEHQDTAGAGKRRSGNGGKLAYTLHGGSMALGVYTAEGIPKTPGILGGYPGSRGETHAVHSSDINEQFENGTIPQEFDALDGEEELTVGKGAPLSMDDDSVVEWWWGSCAGYGDPLTRDPELVADDVQRGTISEEHAYETYGVVLNDDDGSIDAEATERRREAVRQNRLDRASTADDLGLLEGGD